MRLTRGANTQTMWWEHTPRGAAQIDRRRRNAQRAMQSQGNATETDRTAALTHRNATPSHRNGAQTQTTAFKETGTIYKPQRRRKEKKKTRALDEEATTLERKMDQNFELPLPPTIAGRAIQPAEPTWLGETCPNPPPDPAFGLPPPVPPERTRNFRCKLSN